MGIQGPADEPRAPNQGELNSLAVPRAPRVFPLSIEDAIVRRSEIAEIEQLCFGWKPEYLTRLERDLRVRGSIAFVLDDTATLQMLGFTVARPTLVPGEAYLTISAIHPTFQGQKLIGLLRSRLERHLLDRGYRTLASEARIDNGYASKLLRHYADRVVHRESLPPTEGAPYPREFIRIRLGTRG